MPKKLVFFITIIAGLLVAGCSNGDQDQAFQASFDGSVEHVHGMGYAGDDEGLYFASHTGLKIYRDGKWFETTKNNNDYMGFNAVDQGFYTSGHPGKNSDLPNPLGIQRSFDGGESLETIDFEGETDFHYMAVGYNSHDIFVSNHEKNSELNEGFYMSANDGETWEKVSGSGIKGDKFSLAIHPADSNFIAAAGTTGVYLSKDGGGDFQLITENAQGTAVFFDKENLYYASYSSTPSLVKYNLETSEETLMNLPELTEDGPIYIAQNHQDTEEFAIYTAKEHAYLSEDGAESWVQILEDGKIK